MTVIYLGKFLIACEETFERMATPTYTIYNKKDPKFSLGNIKWFHPRRKYCFFPEYEVTLDSGRLREIADFADYLTKNEKRSKK